MPDPDDPTAPKQPHHGASRDRSALADLTAAPGLCATCVHLDLVGSQRSVFVRCALSDADPRFPRYPALPVRACAGYRPEERRPSGAGGGR